MKNIFVDANILLDVILGREFCDESKLYLCHTKMFIISILPTMMGREPMPNGLMRKCL